MMLIWELVTLVAAFLATQIIAKKFGIGWGIMAFVLIAITVGIIGPYLGFHTTGANCDYGPRAC